MRKSVDISVSTDPLSDFQSIIDYAKLLQSKADMLHCDVMDGKFVEKQTFDYSLIKSINASSLIMLDVHLMTAEPEATLEKYIKAGANILTVHYEAFSNKAQLIKAMQLIKSKNCLAGLSFKPETTVKEISNFLYYADIVLVMGVQPGASGQSMLPQTFDKVRSLANFRQANKLTFKIEVDGGVNEQNTKLLSEMGADILVSGSYIFKAEDKEKAIKKLKK